MGTDDIGAKHGLINPQSARNSAAVADLGFFGGFYGVAGPVSAHIWPGSINPMRSDPKNLQPLEAVPLT